MEKNNCYPVTSPECPVSPLANYVLSSQIIANNAPADGASINGVRFILSSPVNFPVANQLLEFSVNGSATLIIPSPYTNNSGVLDVAARSFEPGLAQLFANLAADETVSANSLLTFTSITVYELTSEILVNNAEADGSSANQVRFYLTYNGVGVSGQLTVSGLPGNANRNVTTASDGFYIDSFTSSSPGSFSISAVLDSDPTVSTSQTITFATIMYPRYVGSNTITRIGTRLNLGIEVFLESISIIAGHIYSINDIPTDIGLFQTCGTDYIFETNTNSCIAFRTIDFRLLAENSITPVLALNSGLGQNLHSPGYIYTNTGAYTFTVRVYDLGPA